MTNRDIYLEKALEQIPRLISLEDRNSFSITHGCFDRNYWQWKFVDFSCPRLQEGVFALTALYLKDGNPYFRNEKMKEWILAGINFWMRRQHKNGSFDEAYPNEHSLAATAFTLFYLTETFFLLEKEIPKDFKKDILKTFKKAGNWLIENDETHGFLSNHQAVALASLYNLFCITKEDKYKKRAEYFLKKIGKRQSSEGWLEEYGGADPGYQTHTTFYLARYWQLSGDKKAFDILKKSIEFIYFFVHPNNTLGGEYGSRNTEFYLPAGFEILAEEIPQAKEIADSMINSIKENKSVDLATVDIYNFMPMLNNYLFSYLTKERKEKNPINFENNFLKHFPEAGILIKSTPSYYCIVGTSKGGVIKVYNKISKEPAYLNCGFVGDVVDGFTVSSQWLNRKRKVDLKSNELSVEGSFYKVPQKIFSPRVFIVFRAVMTVAGRFNFFRYLIKNILVKTLIKKEKKIETKFKRSIKFLENEIVLTDEIVNYGSDKFKSLYTKDKFTTIHMGSSRYFQKEELYNKLLTKKELSEEINKKGKIILREKIKI